MGRSVSFFSASLRIRHYKLTADSCRKRRRRRRKQIISAWRRRDERKAATAYHNDLSYSTECQEITQHHTATKTKYLPQRKKQAERSKRACSLKHKGWQGGCASPDGTLLVSLSIAGTRLLSWSIEGQPVFPVCSSLLFAALPLTSDQYSPLSAYCALHLLAFSTLASENDSSAQPCHEKKSHSLALHVAMGLAHTFPQQPRRCEKTSHHRRSDDGREMNQSVPLIRP